MHKNFSKLNQDLAMLNIQISDFIPIVEDIVNMEKASLETAKVLNNEIIWLQKEAAVTKAQTFLSVLRMQNRPLS